MKYNPGYPGQVKIQGIITKFAVFAFTKRTFKLYNYKDFLHSSRNPLILFPNNFMEESAKESTTEGISYISRESTFCLWKATPMGVIWPKLSELFKISWEAPLPDSTTSSPFHMLTPLMKIWRQQLEEGNQITSEQLPGPPE